MAFTKISPRTIHLAGPIHIEGADENDGDWDGTAAVAITPGMLVELFDDTGVGRWRPHASADEAVTRAVALNQVMHNKGIDDDYAIGDLVTIGFLGTGAKFYGIIPSGQDIAAGDLLQSNGDGKLKASSATTAGANLAQFQACDSPGSVVVDTRVIVQLV